MKICDNVKMLETDLDRKYFTKHDQHLNLSGKELIYCIWNYQKVMTGDWESLHDRILEPFLTTAMHQKLVLTVHNSIYLNSQIQFAFW
jgi:hypothetical protein